MNDKITLIDGNQLDCYPIAFTPEETVSGEFSLDTTGHDLQTGKKSHVLTDKELEERCKKEAKLFYEHAHLFLANADKILSDSRLFLAPVNVKNNAAYLVRGGLRRPTLGVYIEWWLYHKEASIDAKGLPIWFFSGTPKLGCYVSRVRAVDRKGVSHRAWLNGDFSAVCKSFAEVNDRYTEFKGRYMAYDLREVIDILEGTTDSRQYFNLHLRLEKVRYDNYITKLKKDLKQARELSLKCQNKIKSLIFRQHRDEVTECYNKYVNLQTEARQSRERFYEQRIELRKALLSGKIDNITYQRKLMTLKKQAREAEYQSWLFQYEGLRTVLGDDAQYLDFSDLEQLIK